MPRSRLSRPLVTDGTLFIGHSETLRDLGVDFEPLPLPQAFAYTKKATAVRGAA